MNKYPNLRLSEFELLVMLALAHLGDEAYGVTIRREIARRSGRGVAIGAVYTALNRLEGRSLVRFTYSDPRPIPGGRARKYAHLTPAGRQALRHAAGALQRMMEGLPGELLPGDSR